MSVSVDLNMDRQRLWLLGGATTASSAIVLAWGTILGHPDILGIPRSLDATSLAFGCSAAAALFGPMVAVEAVSHERLFTPGVDPLARYTSDSFRLGQLFLRGSVEQWVLFAAGVLGLSGMAPPEIAKPAIVVATLVWIASRLVFRIGYAFGPAYRGFGLGAHAQSLVILLYVTDRLASALAGTPGRIASISLFACIEVLLVVQALSASRGLRVQASRRVNTAPD